MFLKGLWQSTRFRHSAILSAVLALIFLGVNISVVGGPDFFNINNAIISLTAAWISSFFFWRISQRKSEPGNHLIWASMALGLGLWAMADTVYAFYAIEYFAAPLSSLADLFWGLGYIPLYFALILRLRTLRARPTRRQIALLAAVNGAWLLLTTRFLLFPIALDIEMQSLLDGLLALFYPLANLGMFVLASLILLLLRNGRFAFSWRVIASGIFIMTFSDSLYSYATWNEIYYPDGLVDALTILIDTTYTLSYMLIAFGAVVYRIVWDLKEKSDLMMITAPAARYYTFVCTNHEHRIITAADNFYHLVGGEAQSQYEGMSLEETLGIQNELFQHLSPRTPELKILSQEPLEITTGHQANKVWVSILCIYDTSGNYNGANIALSADIQTPENLRQPASKELRGMMHYVLSLAGSRPQDERQALQIYFVETIRLLSSTLYQFGGQQIRDTLFEDLAMLIRDNQLKLQISNQVFALPEDLDTSEAARSLRMVITRAYRFVGDFVGKGVVDDELRDLEKHLAAEILSDVDKYQLRAFHT